VNNRYRGLSVKKVRCFVLLSAIALIALNTTCSQRKSCLQNDIILLNKNSLQEMERRRAKRRLQILSEEIEKIEFNRILSQYPLEYRPYAKIILKNKNLLRIYG